MQFITKVSQFTSKVATHTNTHVSTRHMHAHEQKDPTISSTSSRCDDSACFGATSTVMVSPSVTSPVTRKTSVSDVKPGDFVVVADGGRARVRCIVEAPRSRFLPLIKLPGGLTITPTHPIRVDGKWVLPSFVGVPTMVDDDLVYNFVLESNHILLVDGVECCTMGHGFNDDVVKHAYWGTQRVIEDLAKLPGWREGRVRAYTQRDSQGKTIGIRDRSQHAPPVAGAGGVASQGNVQIDDCEEQTCAVCFCEAASFAVVPCGHKCGCEGCLKRVQESHNGQCPICRGPITSLLRVIDSGHDERQDNANEGAGNSAAVDDAEDIDARRLPVAATGVVVPAPDIQVIPAPDPCLTGEDAGDDEDQTVVVRVHVPDLETGVSRSPVDICCVVDISGSMGQEATLQDKTDPNRRESLGDGLVILDIVRHAVTTVIHSLSEHDRLSVVGFDQAADVVVPLCNMTADGMARADQAIKDMRPRGQTNIWGGLLCGLETLRKGDDVAAADGDTAIVRNKTVLLLTDGQPNIVPPKGHIPSLQAYWDSHPEFSCQIMTFGFGYSLDSKLLLDLACAGNNEFAFISDAPMVGNVMTHALANVLSTHTQKATMHLETRSGSEIVSVGGGFATTTAPWGSVVNIGPLQYGQYRDIAIQMRLPADQSVAFLGVTLEFGPNAGEETLRTSMTATERDIDGARIAVGTARLRKDLVETCAMLLKQRPLPHQGTEEPFIKTLADRFAASPLVSDECVHAMHNDVTGRLAKAVYTTSRVQRWGLHYIRGLMRAHQLMQCTNFADPGVQTYGGSLFSQLRSQGDVLFRTLPAPTPMAPLCPMCSQKIQQSMLERHVEGCMSGGGASTYGVLDASGSLVAVPSRTASHETGSSASWSAPTMRTAPAPHVAAAPAVDMSLYMESGSCFGATATVMVKANNAVANNRFQKILVSEVVAGDFVQVAGGVAKVRCVVLTPRSRFLPLIKLPGGLTITPTHPIRVDGKWVLPSFVGVPTMVDDDLVYNFVLESNHILLVDGVECCTMGHGFNDDVVKHAYWGTQRVIEDLAKLTGWDNGRVVAVKLRSVQGDSKLCSASAPHAIPQKLSNSVAVI